MLEALNTWLNLYSGSGTFDTALPELTDNYWGHVGRTHSLSIFRLDARGLKITRWAVTSDLRPQRLPESRWLDGEAISWAALGLNQG